MSTTEQSALVRNAPQGGAPAGRIALVAIALIFVLRYGQEFFIPVVLSILTAYALDPLVTQLRRLRLPQTLAAALVVLGLLGGLAYGVYQLRDQALAAVDSVSEAARNLRERIRAARNPGNGSAIGEIQEAAEEIERTAAEATVGQTPPRNVQRVQVEERFSVMDYVWTGGAHLLSVLGQAVLVVFLVFFILASGDLFKRKLVRIVGTRLSEKKLTLETLNEIQALVGRFLFIQVITGLLVGVLTTLALWYFGVREPAIWGLFAGVANSIPYFGPLIVTVGLSLVSFLQFDSVVMTVKVAGVALLITTVEGMLLTPALMGKAAGINGVAMFVSILFWTWMWGVIGLLVAVPITMTFKIVCERIPDLQPIGELLAER